MRYSKGVVLMKKKDRFRQCVLNLIFIVMCILIAIPFVMLVSVSLSNEKDVAIYGYSI